MRKTDPKLLTISRPMAVVPENPRTDGMRIIIPLIVGCAFFMEGLDSTMIAVSIPAMADSLGESPLRLNLVITSYLLSLAVFIPVSGWIADRLGTRRVFCAAVLIFAGGSALCGLATNLPLLIAMRVVQGFGGAMMTPVGRLILLVGFAVAGLGLFLLDVAIENLGRPIITPAAGFAFFPIAIALVILYVLHARRSASPVLDLNLLKIKTFYVGTVTGGICRMGLDATPFMLPLLFQVGFGLSPIAAGLLSFSSTLGAMFVRSFSRILLRGLGFRRTLVGGAVLSAAVTASYALLSAGTPAWIITVAVLISGCVRSIQYLALNTISYAEVPRSMLSRSTSVGGVVQQLARGFGVAIGAALLAMVAGSERFTVGDFRIVFLLVALIPLLSAFGFLRLGPDDGAEVSGQRTAQPAPAKTG